MWGIIPAAGKGSRIQPLAFSKELLPVGSRKDERGERPMAVSEHLIERLLVAGMSKLCFVVSPGKSDILEYYGGEIGKAHICYVVQEEPAGLCDAVFRAIPLVGDDEWALIGLPDTIWFPEDGLLSLSRSQHELEFLLFPVEHPEFFDAVVTDESGAVSRIEVKKASPSTHWVWGAFKARGRVLRELHALWSKDGRHDEYIGTLVNAYIEGGGRAHGVPVGRAYVDVGTVNGYREATRLLEAVNLVDGARWLDSAERHGLEPSVEPAAGRRGGAH